MGWPFGLPAAMSGFCFLCFGALCRSLLPWFERLRLPLLLSGVLLSGVLTYAVAHWNRVRVIMAIGTVGHHSLFVLAGLLGSVFLLFAARSVETGLHFAVPVLAFPGKHSLFYFAVHYLAFHLLDLALQRCGVSVPAVLWAETLYVLAVFLLCTVFWRLTAYYAPALEGKVPAKPPKK